MLTFTKGYKAYIVTANKKFVGRLYKDKGMWYLEYNVSFGHVHVPYETSLELTLSELEDEFNTWSTHKNVAVYLGELSHTEYKE